MLNNQRAKNIENVSKYLEFCRIGSLLKDYENYISTTKKK